MAGPDLILPPRTRWQRRRAIGRLAAWTAASLAAWRIGGRSDFTPSASSSAQPEPLGFVLGTFSAPVVTDRVSRTALQPIIKRPVGGPKAKPTKEFGGMTTAHLPVGSKRLPGPLRPLYLNKTFATTLESAISPFGRGGLRGRYSAEIAEHLNDMAALRAQGHRMPATMFWDIENLDLKEAYGTSPRERMGRVLSWFAGVTDAMITRVEMVEFTRHATTPQEHFNGGKLNWHTTLRQMGGVVHRCWPRRSDAADRVLLDRFRATLDEIEAGGEPRILIMASSDKGFIPMLEYAQQQGVTVVRIAGQGEANYYPAGGNFSVPVHIPGWGVLKAAWFGNTHWMRPEEEWLKFKQGPKRWNAGIVQLEPADHEEMDRRIFHDFIAEERRLVLDGSASSNSMFDGRWVRGGLRLNETLVAKLERAYNKEGKDALEPEAKAALAKQLDVLRDDATEGVANVYWNFESMPMDAQGPPQPEMLARVTRWLSGVLDMPVNRVEVSRFVEPWEKLGSFAHDWLFHMDRLGMMIHRVWPPRSEMTNLVLTGSISALATMVSKSDARNSRPFAAAVSAFAARQATAEAYEAAEGNIAGAFGDDRKLLVKVAVEVTEDRSEIIMVREGDVPEQLAEDFVTKYDLDSEIIEPLTDHIRDNLKQALADQKETGGDAVAEANGVLRSPRLICIMSEDVPFDQGLREAQQAGINVAWFGPQDEGLFYVANSDVRIPIETLPWKTLTAELSQAVRSPFSGYSTPDAPAAISQQWNETTAEPVDPAWGQEATLALDQEPLKVSAKDQIESRIASSSRLRQ